MLIRKKSIAITLATVALGVASVTSQKSVPNAFADSPVPLKTRVQLTGAGATFPAPLYQNWFVMLNRKVPNLQVNYQGTGGGAGVEQFIKGTVDFAGSDVAMKDEEIAKVSKGGVLMLPVTAGEILEQLRDAAYMNRQVSESKTLDTRLRQSINQKAKGRITVR